MTGVPAGLAAALSDRYGIERELGQGGMATVYLAQDLKHERVVARFQVSAGGGRRPIWQPDGARAVHGDGEAKGEKGDRCDSAALVAPGPKC